MNKKTRAKLEASLNEAMKPPSGKEFIPLPKDSNLSRRELMDRLLENYSDDKPVNAKTSELRIPLEKSKRQKIVPEMRPVRKKTPLPENYEPVPFVHPLTHMLDPMDVHNVFAEIRAAFNQISVDLTGKTLDRNQMPDLLELVNLLETEIIQAAAKESEPIENLPAFALEYFKRKLSVGTEK